MMKKEKFSTGDMPRGVLTSRSFIAPYAFSNVSYDAKAVSEIAKNAPAFSFYYAKI